MSGIKDQAQIEALRQRLYERGAKFEPSARTSLRPTVPPTESPVIRTDWHTPASRPAPTTDIRSSLPMQPAIATPATPVTPTLAPAAVSVSQSPTTATTAPDLVVSDEPALTARPRRRYRMYIILFSLLVFILGVGTSSFYLFMGANQISANNIGFIVTGPTSLGGGEVLSLQVGINNQNPVPLESATLIVRFPNGTRSTDDPPRPLFEERIPLETIPSGEIRNLTVQAAVFGEENSEHTIEAVVEYRVAGSNSLFERRAEPVTYRISSAPIGLRLTAVPSVAAGQEVPLTLRVTSNSLTPLTDVLIRAEYPSTFSFIRAEPAPVSGQNVWLLETIAPNETIEIAVRGTLSGFVDDQYQIRFVAGVPRTPGSFELGGELAQTSSLVGIEESLIGVSVAVGGSSDRTVVVRGTEPQPIVVTLTNTQQQPLTDVTITSTLSGPMVPALQLDSSNGRIDEATRTITWQVVGAGDLVEIQPGQTTTVQFTASVDPVPASGSWTVRTDIRAKREGVDVLVGTTETEVKYATPIMLAREISQAVGPVPPVAGEATTYTVTLAASAGNNRLSNPVISTNLPLYVTWLDQTSGPGTVEYNPTSRQVRWTPGDIAGNQTAQLSFQIRFIPSAEQVRQTPNLVGVSTLQANDAFTGTLERATAPVVTTELSTELGFPPGNGRIIRSE